MLAATDNDGRETVTGALGIGASAVHLNTVGDFYSNLLLLQDAAGNQATRTATRTVTVTADATASQ